MTLKFQAPPVKVTDSMEPADAEDEGLTGGCQAFLMPAQ